MLLTAHRQFLPQADAAMGAGESEGRVVLVGLTSAGTALGRRIAAVHTRDIEARFGALLTTTEAGNVDAILRRLLAEPPME